MDFLTIKSCENYQKILHEMHTVNGTNKHTKIHILSQRAKFREIMYMHAHTHTHTRTHTHTHGHTRAHTHTHTHTHMHARTHTHRNSNWADESTSPHVLCPIPILIVGELEQDSKWVIRVTYMGTCTCCETYRMALLVYLLCWQHTTIECN